MSPGYTHEPSESLEKMLPKGLPNCNLGASLTVWPDVSKIQPAQPPQAPQAPAEGRFVRVATQQVQGVQQITSAEQVQAAHIRLDRLRDELQDAASRRNTITQNLRSADVEAREGYLRRLEVLDERILTIEREITQTNLALSTAPAEALVAAASAGRQVDPDLEAVRGMMGEVVPIIAILSVFVFMPIAIAIARLIWRRATNAPRGAAVPDHATQQKLDHLQQAVDTIAIEVERISEGQRFVAKLMSDRSLGAGAAEPVRVGAKSADGL